MYIFVDSCPLLDITSEEGQVNYDGERLFDHGYILGANVTHVSCNTGYTFHSRRNLLPPATCHISRHTNIFEWSITFKCLLGKGSFILN